jgi:dUTP pyrophosphatase
MRNLGENNQMTKQTQNIKIKYHNPSMIPLVQKEDSDWIDLRCSEETIILQGEFKKVSLGTSMEIPAGFEAHIVPRSSTFSTWGIIQTNGIGIIDNHYKGNNDVWAMPVYATRDTIIQENDRICQFRIIEKQPNLIFEEVEDMNNEDRGGFGHSGKN